MSTAWFADDDGHHLAAGVKGNLVDLDVIRRRELLMQLFILKNGPVENVLESGLEMTIKKRQFQYAVVFFECNVAMLFQNYAIHREGAGLVRTEDIHRTEVLDRVEPLDDHFFARHQECTLGQAHADDHGEHFGRE